MEHETFIEKLIDKHFNGVTISAETCDAIRESIEYGKQEGIRMAVEAVPEEATEADGWD